MYGEASPASDAPALPLPQISQDYAPFYEGVAAHKLLVQQCAACGTVNHPPQVMCPSCQGLDFGWRESGLEGILYSYTVHHHPPLAGFASPHPVGLAEMEDGFRLVAALHGLEADGPAIGMKLRVEFFTREDGFPLFRFVPAAEGEGA